MKTCAEIMGFTINCSFKYMPPDTSEESSCYNATANTMARKMSKLGEIGVFPNSWV